MAGTAVTSVDAYVAALAPDRRPLVDALRATILANLDRDYAEGVAYGMIGYHVPLSVYPPGYHCTPGQPLPFAALASQKTGVSLHLMSLYCGSDCGTGAGEELDWFRQAWLASGKKKLDMGKACIRFKRVEDVALDVIGEAIRRMPAALYIQRHALMLAAPRPGRTNRV